MAEGGVSPPRCTSVVYSRLGDSEDEMHAEVAAGSVYRGYWSDYGRSWDGECQASPGLEQLLHDQHSPHAGYRRFGPNVPRRRTTAASSSRTRRKTQKEPSPERPVWRLDLQVREPQMEDIGCCNICLGTRLKPYPVTFEIITMSDSPLLCANYMVVRRWDEDFIKLYSSLGRQFAFNTQLMSGLAEHRPLRLAQINEDALTLQCGRHKKLLKWILSNNAFYSSHDLHAFIGCKADSCPSQRTDSVIKFPQYPQGTLRRRPNRDDGSEE